MLPSVEIDGTLLSDLFLNTVVLKQSDDKTTELRIDFVKRIILEAAEDWLIDYPINGVTAEQLANDYLRRY